MQITTLEEFAREVTQSSIPVIANFFGEYCAECMKMMPVFEALSLRYVQKVKFIKVDSDLAKDLVKKFYVLKVPCVIVFDEGQLTARYNGVMDKKELIQFIERAVGNTEK